MIKQIILVCVFAALSALPELAAKSERGSARLMQGPMLGAVDSDSFLVWMRASWTWDIQVLYSTTPDMADAQATTVVTAAKADDYCVTLRVDGLKPDTQYYYRFLIDGGEDKYLAGTPAFRARTAPAPGEPARFTVGYGSCARWQSDPHQPIWRSVATYDPDLFFWLGDSVYGDTLDPDILAEEFTRQREVALLSPLLPRIPQLATWDDHDFGLNNHDRTNPTKAQNLEVWKRYWPNPAHGLPGVPGVFFQYNYGGVDFFFIDNRYHRSPNDDPDGPQKTTLGARQLSWLKEGLKASEAPFKVIVSGGVWTRGKGPRGDAWSAFMHERNVIFDYIRDEQISGVVLLSGDTHTAELNVIPWSDHGGYDLYDLTSSPLAQKPGIGWLNRDVEQRIRLPYNGSANFGLLQFDLTKDDPQLTFQIINDLGKPVWRLFTLNASELSNGVRSWPAKQDAAARRWMERFRGE